ncbi:hypothetical protein F4861DRAFT_541940 [Xylaria intraflava]|nr:hypothetical protein F4861DRAFT_541940 [Xylaria intraflava]
MSETAESPGVEGNDTIDSNPEQHSRHDHEPASERKSYPLRLWPPPCLQAYCLDHFMMECEIYHEQENERYKKLVGHIRDAFLEDREKKKAPKKPTAAPTRCQPPRRAKNKNSEQSSTTTKPKPTRPPEPERPSSAPFKPSRLEKAFRDSQGGTMVGILSAFRENLELHKTWENYRPALEEKIREAETRQKTELAKGNKVHENCSFGGPLAIECRYCGFVGTVQVDVAVTPRKLAAPAAMHDIELSGTKEWGVMFRGTNFFVDVCGEKTMIVLVDFRGVVDCCMDLFGDPEAMPDSPTQLAARLESIESRPSDIKTIEVKRRLHELISGK